MEQYQKSLHLRIPYLGQTTLSMRDPFYLDHEVTEKVSSGFLGLKETVITKTVPDKRHQYWPKSIEQDGNFYVVKINIYHTYDGGFVTRTHTTHTTLRIPMEHAFMSEEQIY